MTCLALVHGARGMLFFSYYPKLPRTWAEVGVLARELHRLTPFLVLPGEEPAARCSGKAIHARCIRIGRSGLLIAVNTEPGSHTGVLEIEGMRKAEMAARFENRRRALRDGKVTDRFMPYGVHVYQWGDEPSLPTPGTAAER